MVVGELQGIDDAQDFVEVTARAGRIGNCQTNFFVGIDDEDRAHGERIARAGLWVQHAVEGGDFFVVVSQNWIVDVGALRFVDVFDPAFVRVGIVYAEGDGFGVALFELFLQGGNQTQLGGANGRVVCGVGE